MSSTTSTVSTIWNNATNATSDQGFSGHINRDPKNKVSMKKYTKINSIIENKKIQNKLHAKIEKKENIISYKLLYFYEMNELEEFIYKTKSEMKSDVSIINLKMLSLLPAKLILIIREYLPIEVRTQVLENTWNIPYIEYTDNIYDNDTIRHLCIIFIHCKGNFEFCEHPVFKCICKYYRHNTHSLYYYTIMFNAFILLIKSFYLPEIAYKILILIKQNNLHLPRKQYWIVHEIQLLLAKK